LRHVLGGKFVIFSSIKHCKGSGTKELVSLRLDKEALAAFRATGPGWQVRINDVVARSAKRLGKMLGKAN